MMLREVLCPYCGKQAKLVPGSEIGWLHPNANNSSYWVCFDCEAYVGTHKRNTEYNTDGTEPLGTLANRGLRLRRLHVHDSLDPLWKKLKWDRNKAYEWLAQRMGIPRERCHIGLFDGADCDKAMELLKELAEFAQQNEPSKTKVAVKQRKKVKHVREDCVE